MCLVLRLCAACVSEIASLHATPIVTRPHHALVGFKDTAADGTFRVCRASSSGYSLRAPIVCATLVGEYPFTCIVYTCISLMCRYIYIYTHICVCISQGDFKSRTVSRLQRA